MLLTFLPLGIFSTNQPCTWTDNGKHRGANGSHISMFIQVGQPFFWLTLNPSDVDSPFGMHYNGAGIDLPHRAGETCGKIHHTAPPLIANGPVASATFFHETIEAVLKNNLRFGANDSDGGGLGSVKAYIGMTEEQFCLIHGHLIMI